MTLTIEIAPEKEDLLRAKAAQHGVPLSELLRGVVENYADAAAKTAAPVVFSQDRQTRNAQLRALLHAPAEVRVATLAAGRQALAADYESDRGLTEFTRAFQNEDFCDAD